MKRFALNLTIAALAIAASAVSRASSPLRGPGNAPVSMLIAVDYQCPFCKKLMDYLPQLEADYGDKLHIELSHNPLSFHVNAMPAAIAAECARAQGKFRDFTTTAFERQKEFNRGVYLEIARGVGVADLARFETCIDQKETLPAISADLMANKALGVEGTPTAWINGTRIYGAYPYEEFKKAIDQALAAVPKP